MSVIDSLTDTDVQILLQAIDYSIAGKPLTWKQVMTIERIRAGMEPRPSQVFHPRLAANPRLP